MECRLDYDVSTPEAIAEIRENYDATYISIGSHNAKSMGIPGGICQGSHSCCGDVKRYEAMTLCPILKTQTVVVIGGGNVAMDVARTAKRLGATDVSIVYRRRRDDMTALPEEIGAAVSEGCSLMRLKAPSRIQTDKRGRVKAAGSNRR